eukprot:3606837-Rhodomonas_salina.1
MSVLGHRIPRAYYHTLAVLNIRVPIYATSVLYILYHDTRRQYWTLHSAYEKRIPLPGILVAIKSAHSLPCLLYTSPSPRDRG